MEQEHVNSVVNAMSSLFREPVLEGGKAKGTLQFRLFFGKISLRLLLFSYHSSSIPTLDPCNLQY